MKYFYVIIAFLIINSCGIKIHTRSPKSDIKTREIVINNSSEFINITDFSVSILDQELNIFKGEALILVRLQGVLKNRGNEYPRIRRIIFLNKLTNRLGRDHLFNSTYNWEIEILPEMEILNYKSKDDILPETKTFDLKEEYVFYAYTGVNNLKFIFGDKVREIKLSRGK